MRIFIIWVMGFLLALCAPMARAQMSAGSKEEVARWVKDLGSDVALDREAAEVGLSLMRPESFGLIEAAAKDPNIPQAAATRLDDLIAREKPRVQARLRIAKEQKEIWDWNAKDALEQYGKAGTKDPKWDAAARKGIELFVTPVMYRQGQDPRTALEQAINAGCEDPLILYLEARVLSEHGVDDPDRLDRLYHMAVDGMEKSQYSPMRKLYTINRYSQFKRQLLLGNRAKGGAITQDDLQLLAHLDQTAMQNWEKMAQDGHVPVSWMAESGEMLLDNLKGWTTGDRNIPFTAMFNDLQKAKVDQGRLLAFKGRFLVRYAWDARGGGFANTVTPEGWKLFGERLAAAEETLTQSWQADPNNPKPCLEMMRVELGQGKGREREVLWFTRAIAADPDNADAYSSMMYYLEPKWYGSTKDMVEFGQQCRDTKNWYGGVPFKLVDAHIKVADAMPKPEAYYAIGWVWRDIQSIYQPYLKARPDNNATRSAYTRLACQAGQWDEARKQFAILGDKAVPAYFGGPEKMEAFRRQAMREKL
jgi:hypothetical protein